MLQVWECTHPSVICVVLYAIHRGHVDKRALLDNLETVMLALDETIDGGYVHACSLHFWISETTLMPCN